MSEKSLTKSLGPEKDEKDPATLSELFDGAFEMFNGINKTQEPTNSSKVQVSGISKKKLTLLSGFISERSFSQCYSLLSARATRRKGGGDAFDFFASHNFRCERVSHVWIHPLFLLLLPIAVGHKADNEYV